MTFPFYKYAYAFSLLLGLHANNLYSKEIDPSWVLIEEDEYKISRASASFQHVDLIEKKSSPHSTKSTDEKKLLNEYYAKAVASKTHYASLKPPLPASMNDKESPAEKQSSKNNWITWIQSGIKAVLDELEYDSSSDSE